MSGWGWMGWIRARRWQPYDAVRVALGLLLLTAAVLKTHQLATEPILGTGLLDSRWLLLATVEFELLLALCLLANVWPKATRAVVLGCFALFTCVSLYKALAGASSCGCFGAMAVSPWITLALDTLAMTALLLVRPRTNLAILVPNLRVRTLSVGVAGSAWSVAAAFVGYAILSGPGRLINESGERPSAGEQVVDVGMAKVRVSELWHDFGVLKPFSVAQTEFRLDNISETTVRIERIATSCGCTTVGDMRDGTIMPGASAVIPVSLSTGSRTTLSGSIWIFLTAADEQTRRQHTLQLYGSQPQSMEVVPTQVNFGPVARSEPAAASIRLTESSEDRFEVRSFDPGTLPISAEIHRNKRGGLGSHVLRLSLDASALPAGEHTGVARINTTSRFRPVVELPVRFSVAAEVKARPAIVDFGAVSSDAENPPFIVSLQHQAEQPLDVCVVEVPNGLVATIQESGTRARVAVSLRRALTASVYGVVKLRAKWAGAEEIVELPCYMYLRPK